MKQERRDAGVSDCVCVWGGGGIKFPRRKKLKIAAR